MSLRDALRRLEAVVADALDSWVVRSHAPIDVNDKAVCPLCNEAWPCKTAGDVMDRRDRYRAEQG